MPRDIFAQFRPEFDDAIEHLRVELSNLRTGRANPSMVENIMVEAYGSRQALMGLASLSTPDARSIVIEPWDKSILKDIEKGIQEANIGINPTIQGSSVRVVMPALTEEGRRGLIKIMNEKLEETRIAIRGVRDRAKAAILDEEKKKMVTEDEKYKLLEQLDKTAAGFNERIKTIAAEKEKEVMTI